MRLAESGLTADAVIELGGIREATKSFTVKDLEPVAPTHNVDVDLGPNMSTAEPIASPERMEEDLDRLESENHDLRQEVQQQRQPKPTKYDKLQLEFDGLKSELYISRERRRTWKNVSSSWNRNRRRTTNAKRRSTATVQRSAACAHPETNGWASTPT